MLPSFELEYPKGSPTFLTCFIDSFAVYNPQISGRYCMVETLSSRSISSGCIVVLRASYVYDVRRS